jgi:hypothetical protein
MRSKSAEIQERINELEQLIQGEASDFQKTSWETELEQKKADLVNVLAEEAQQQERIDAQTEMVESITLAYDYNEILGNPLANETIIENIKQFRLQDSAEHFAVIDKLKFEFSAKLEITEEMWKDAVRATTQLQERLDAENEQAKLDAIEIIELSKRVAQLGLEKQEAETSRDNAARLLTEANEELEKHKQSTIENCDLRQQIEALKQELTAKKALTVSGNEKLAELAAKAKESTAAAAQRGIERWNQQYGMDIPVLEMTEIQPVNAVTETDEAEQEIPFQESNQVDANANGENPTGEGNGALDEVVETEESQMSDLLTEIPFTKETMKRFADMFNDVSHLKHKVAEIESKLVA